MEIAIKIKYCSVLHYKGQPKGANERATNRHKIT